LSEDCFKKAVAIGMEGAHEASLTLLPIELMSPSGGCTWICCAKKLCECCNLAPELNLRKTIFTMSSVWLLSPYASGS
jgi:hypothetical protein